MRLTLLEMTQKILSDLDAEPINAIGDTSEALQVVSIIEDTYYNIVTNKHVPEFNHFIKLTALSNSTTPTHFLYPTSVDKVLDVWYDTSTDNTFSYTPVVWMDPMDFIGMLDANSSGYVLVSDLQAGTQLRIRTDKKPQYYSSFDDKYIVMDSHLSTVEATLQSSKSRAYGTKVPVFDATDGSYTAAIDENMFPLFLNEAKSVCMSILKGQSDPKIDQAARRARYNLQNDRYTTERNEPISSYGR